MTKKPKKETKEAPKKPGPSKFIECEVHGKCDAVNFAYSGVPYKKVCFKCWVDKTTEGLKDFSKKEKAKKK